MRPCQTPHPEKVARLARPSRRMDAHGLAAILRDARRKGDALVWMRLMVHASPQYVSAVVELADRGALGGGTLAPWIAKKIEFGHGVVTLGVVNAVTTLFTTLVRRMQLEPYGWL